MTAACCDHRRGAARTRAPRAAAGDPAHPPPGRCRSRWRSRPGSPPRQRDGGTDRGPAEERIGDRRFVRLDDRFHHVRPEHDARGAQRRRRRGPADRPARPSVPPMLQVSVRSGTVCTNAVGTIGDSSQPGDRKGLVASQSEPDEGEIRCPGRRTRCRRTRPCGADPRPAGRRRCPGSAAFRLIPMSLRVSTAPGNDVAINGCGIADPCAGSCAISVISRDSSLLRGQRSAAVADHGQQLTGTGGPPRPAQPDPQSHPAAGAGGGAAPRR